MTKCRTGYFPCNKFFSTTFNYIKRLKPNRVFIVNNWYLWLIYGNKNGLKNNWKDCYQQYADPTKQSYLDIVHSLKGFENAIR